MAGFAALSTGAGGVALLAVPGRYGIITRGQFLEELVIEPPQAGSAEPPW